MEQLTLQQLKDKSIFEQFQFQKEVLIKIYADKISKLPVKWIQEEDEVYRVPSEEEKFLLDELNESLEILRKQFKIDTLYHG